MVPGSGGLPGSPGRGSGGLPGSAGKGSGGLPMPPMPIGCAPGRWAGSTRTPAHVSKVSQGTVPSGFLSMSENKAFH